MILIFQESHQFASLHRHKNHEGVQQYNTKLNKFLGLEGVQWESLRLTSESEKSRRSENLLYKNLSEK